MVFERNLTVAEFFFEKNQPVSRCISYRINQGFFNGKTSLFWHTQKNNSSLDSSKRITCTHIRNINFSVCEKKKNKETKYIWKRQKKKYMNEQQEQGEWKKTI